MLKYHPYPANDGKHKYYIVTNNDIQYKYDFFSEYLSVDPYENDDESE